MSGVTDCGHRWVFEDVNFINTAPLEPWQAAKSELQETLSKLVKVLRDIVLAKEKVPQLL